MADAVATYVLKPDPCTHVQVQRRACLAATAIARESVLAHPRARRPEVLLAPPGKDLPESSFPRATAPYTCLVRDGARPSAC
jgi:hypothetical protein